MTKSGLVISSPWSEKILPGAGDGGACAPGAGGQGKPEAVLRLEVRALVRHEKLSGPALLVMTAAAHGADHPGLVREQVVVARVVGAAFTAVCATNNDEMWRPVPVMVTSGTAQCGTTRSGHQVSWLTRPSWRWTPFFGLKSLRELGAVCSPRIDLVMRLRHHPAADRVEKGGRRSCCGPKSAADHLFLSPSRSSETSHSSGYRAARADR